MQINKEDSATPLALSQLPMYDWPEIATATNALWGAIRDAFNQRDIRAPTTLDRSLSREQVWLSKQLLLSQSCGLPLVQTLGKRVKVLGSFAYQGIAPAGEYHSVIIARADNGKNLASLQGKRVAINGADSYSGCLALKCAVAPFTPGDGFFSEVLITGSHRESIRAVANGSADTAAIDCVNWQLARRHDAAAMSVDIIAHTPSRPGLPLITAGSKTQTELGLMREALASAVAGLDENTRAVTGIRSFQPLDDTAYAGIANDLRRCGDLALSPA
ncbi:MAG: PhnD/SsuA/transferrin family substrate-binding protein [Acidiferrobacteraceae bacterium]|nr:PhnD/SsuA/transferrin family substrate-binding protein [Acidiferrobacteraceae bacterium]